jgi:hypothetical protein
LEIYEDIFLINVYALFAANKILSETIGDIPTTGQVKKY